MHLGPRRLLYSKRTNPELISSKSIKSEKWENVLSPYNIEIKTAAKLLYFFSVIEDKEEVWDYRV